MLCMIYRKTRKTRRRLLLLAVLLLGSFLGYMWMVEARLSVPWEPDAGAQQFAQRPLAMPKNESLIGEYTLPLRTQGRDIVDGQQRRFRLRAVNWYGASDKDFVVGGLDVQHRAAIAQTIRRLGFNTVRLPYSDELVMTNPVITAERVAANTDLAGQRALDVFVATVEALTDAGLAVIVNNHITAARWCCGANPCDAGWENEGGWGWLPVWFSRLIPGWGWCCRVRQTEEAWMVHWETVMVRLADNERVIGADLRNEVRGLWGTMSWERWATAAERCGNRLLALNPAMWSAWAYLLDSESGESGPVWVAEFGAPHRPSVGDARYWRHLVRFLAAVDADFGYWAVNPRKPDGSKETYGLVDDDWLTPVLGYRMRDLQWLVGLR